MAFKSQELFWFSCDAEDCEATSPRCLTDFLSEEAAIAAGWFVPDDKGDVDAPADYCNAHNPSQLVVVTS